MKITKELREAIILMVNSGFEIGKIASWYGLSQRVVSIIYSDGLYDEEEY